MNFCFPSFRILSSLSFAASLLFWGGCASRVQDETKDDHIVAHWTFDSVSENKINDKAGKHGGVVIGANSGKLIRKGLYGNAVFFDLGRNYVQVPHSDDLSLTDDFSIKCVFMPFSVSGFKTIIWKGDRTASPQRINYFVDIRNGKLELKTKGEDGEWSVFATSDPVIKPNKWHEALILWKDGKVSIYVNGKKEPVSYQEKKFKGMKLIANKDDVMIGCGHNSRGLAGYPFHGLIDEIVIYNKSIDVNSQIFLESEKARASFLRSKLLDDSRQLLRRTKVLNKLSEKYEAQVSKSESNKDKVRLAILKANKKLEKIGSSCSVFLDDFNQKVDAFGFEIAYRESFLRNAKPGASFALSVLPACRRIVKEPSFLKKLGKLERSIAVSMARNEYEGFQAIVLGNPDRDSNGINVGIGDFVHENGKDKLSAGSVKWGWIKSVKTTMPDIPVDFVGEIPDVIMENGNPFDVAKSDFTPVYFRFHADAKTVPGTYKGSVKFTHNGCSEKIEVNLEIYDFVLPKASSLKIAFSFFESFYKKWYGYKKLTQKQKMYIYRYLLKYRLAPNNIYSHDKCYPSLSSMKELKADGANFCTINVGGRKKDVSEKVAALRPTIEKLKKMGLYKDAYFYSFDELASHMKDYDKAKELLPAIQKAYPDLKRMQTSFPNPKIAPLFNVWCPLFDYFANPGRLKILEKMRKKPNGEIWWYAADEPCYPFPNFFLDYPVFDCRIIMTLSYMYNVKGILYWCINREWSTNDVKGAKWPDARWNPYIYNVFSKKRVYKNGMGNFTYPGPDGIIYPSLRLENLRDGIEDYEYLKLLEGKVAELKKKDASSGLVEDAETLLKVPVKVAVAINNFSSNPKHLLEYRKNVANMIVKIQDELKRTQK